LKINSKKIALVILCLATIILGFRLGKNRLPFHLADLLRSGNTVRVNYEKFDALFGNDQTFFILVENTKSEAQKSGQYKKFKKILGEIHWFLKKSRKFKKINSLNVAEYFTLSGDYVFMEAFIDKYGQISEEAADQLKSDFWKNTLISPDGNHLMVTGNFNKKILKTSQGIAAVAELINILNKLEVRLPGVKFHLLGVKFAEYYLLTDAIRNQKIITPLLLLLLGILIYFLFRSFGILLCFLTCILLSYALTIMVIFLNEGGISAYSGFAMFFVLIVATSDLIHFFSVFFLHKEENLEKKLKYVKKKMLVPCFLTSLTTSIGFLSLMVSEIMPISHIGLYSAAGSIICFLVTFYFLPMAITTFNFNHFNPKGLPTFKLDKVFGSAISHPKRMILFFIFFSGILLFFCTRLKVDDGFYDKFGKNHPLTISIQKYTQFFHFLDTIDLGIKLKKGSPSDPINHKIMVKFESEIEKHSSVSYIKSHAKFYHYLRETFNTGLDKQGKSEVVKKRRLKSLYRMLINMDVFEDFYHRKAKVLRSMVFLPDSSSVTIDKVIKSINQVYQKGDYKKHFELEVMGNASLRSFINKNLISGILKSLIMSLFLIFLVFLVLFRSFKWAGLGMLPNVIPLLFIGGLMGLLNVAIESNLVLMVCVTIGIAVDDTIHFLYALKIHLRDKKMPLIEGIVATYNETSKALLGTTFVFVLSFPCFFLAELKLYIQAGVYVMLSLMLALAADLLLLPALFAYFPDKKEKTLSTK